jgi:hypothetical protein
MCASRITRILKKRRRGVKKRRARRVQFSIMAVGCL